MNAPFVGPSADAIHEFQDAMAAAGIVVRGQIIADGKIHRYHVEGDHKGSRNAWALLHLDEKPAGAFGCNKRYGDKKITWSAKGSKPLTAEERAAFKEKMESDRRRRAEEEAAMHAMAAERANAIWNGAAEASDVHPYLKRKGVAPFGLRVGDWVREYGTDPNTGQVREARVSNALLVPIRNQRKQIVSLQAIFPDEKNALKRDKDFLPGGEKRGCWFAIGKPAAGASPVVVVICEGYATGASVHMATGLAVVVAFDAGNLLPVAETVRRLMPAAVILFAADNDVWTKAPIDNPGVTRAREAAERVGGLVAVPEFAAAEGKPTDFNDLLVREGDAAVKAQVMAVLTPVPAAARPAPENPAPPQAPAAKAPAPPAPKTEKAKPAKAAKPKAAAKDEEDDGDVVDTSRYFTILGCDREKIYVLHHETRMVKHYSSRGLDKGALGDIADINWWEMNFHGDKGANWDAAINWLRRRAFRMHYDPTLRRGRGAWEDEGRQIYHFGDVLMVDGVETDISKLESKYIYERARALPQPADEALSDEDGKRLLAMAKRFRWKHPGSAVLLAGWVALAPICGALRWRPHIWITGGAGSGKSTVLGDYVHLLAGGWAIFAQGNSTEPGLRQTLKSDALSVLFDESEQNNERERNRMQAALSLIRQSSTQSAARTFKGTMHGEAMDFMIRSAFCLSSIQVGIEHQADYERIAVLRLCPARETEDAGGEWKVLSAALTALRRDNLQAALMRRAIDLLPITLKNIEIFAEVAAGRLGTQRHGDQYGTLIAGAWSLISQKVVTRIEAEQAIDRHDWKDFLKNAETGGADKALRHLAGSFIRLPRGEHATVYDLICCANGISVEGLDVDRRVAVKVLKSHGMRVDDTGTQLLYRHDCPGFVSLFKASPFETNPGSCLHDVSKTHEGNVRIEGPSQPCRAILLSLVLDGEQVSGGQRLVSGDGNAPF